MRILVIGGTRFVGPRAARQLVEKSHQVTLFHRRRTEANLPEGVGRIRGDRRDLATFVDEFRRLDPEVVLDMVPMNERESRDVMGVF